MAVIPTALPTIDKIIPELEKNRIIYIGEQHDRFAHHVNQLIIIKKLHESGLQLAVGMEMFKKPFQPVIDDYMASRSDERRFLESSSYFSEWGYNYHLYKPIVDYLKQERIPLVALNLESDITSRVARGGMDGLEADRKDQLPSTLDFTDKTYGEDLKQVFAFHGTQEEISDFDHFLEAQVLWDESMAETAHEFLKSAPHRTLVVLAGNGHLRYKYGIPERLYRRNREPYVIILQDEPAEKGIADYVLLTQKLEVREPPKLGVTLKETSKGLRVTGVLSQSPAEKAGVRKEDVITRFDTQPVNTLSDLRLALFYAETGPTHDLGVLRDKERLKLKVTLGPASSSGAP